MSLETEQAAMRARWKSRVRFGRSNEVLTIGWLERPGYPQSFHGQGSEDKTYGMLAVAGATRP